MGYLFAFDIELHELFVYYGDKSSIASFANIFSHSVSCLFILLMVSFAVQKLLSLIRSHCLFLFSLLKKDLAVVYAMFSSKSFTVSSLTLGL